jgi:hypothetical protein
MMLALGLTMAQSAVVAMTVPAPLPQSVEAAISAYQNCLFDAIDEQDRGGTAAFSEREVLSACASVRRAELVNAVAPLSGAGWSAGASRRRIHRRFAELDESVWTIVGHARIRRAGKR